MAAPSNIRINPFIGDGGTTNYIELVETHVIPSASPFLIRLNEVPQKKDPSNMKVEYVDSKTGRVNEGVLREVAATPGAGEYRLDYSTNANGDEDWNTGLIEFSSADANNCIRVSYTGMGTLASVNSNRFPSWWLDRGDGSDGDFIPNGNTTISGVKQYKSVFIPPGVTVNVNKFVKIKCQGAVVIWGEITVNNRATSGGSSDSLGQDGTCSIGGAGGSGQQGRGGAAGGKMIGNLDASQDITYYGASGGGGGQGGHVNEFGGYGGAGGAGGGSVCILASEVHVNGKIYATGGAGSSSTYVNPYRGGGGGGGGGGSVFIIANLVKNNGTISVDGGAGGAGNNAGAAGGKGFLVLKELGEL